MNLQEDEEWRGKGGSFAVLSYCKWNPLVSLSFNFIQFYQSLEKPKPLILEVALIEFEPKTKGRLE